MNDGWALYREGDARTMIIVASTSLSLLLGVNLVLPEVVEEEMKNSVKIPSMIHEIGILRSVTTLRR